MGRVAVPIVLALLGCMAGAAARGVMPVRLAETEMTFSRPHGLVLAPDGEFLYVVDVGNHAIKVLDPLTLRTVGVFGQGELRSPHDVAFDPAGRLLVADSGNDRILLYRLNGAPRTE